MTYLVLRSRPRANIWFHVFRIIVNRSSCLGILRLMAYNVVQYFRKRRLRQKDKDTGGYLPPMRWRLVFKTILKVAEGDFLPELMSEQAVI